MRDIEVELNNLHCTLIISLFPLLFFPHWNKIENKYSKCISGSSYLFMYIGLDKCPGSNRWVDRWGIVIKWVKTSEEKNYLKTSKGHTDLNSFRMLSWMPHWCTDVVVWVPSMMVLVLSSFMCIVPKPFPLGLNEISFQLPFSLVVFFNFNLCTAITSIRKQDG